MADLFSDTEFPAQEIFRVFSMLWFPGWFPECPQKWLTGTIRPCLTGQENRGTQPLMKGKAFASRVLHPLHFSTNNPRQGPLSKPRAVETVEIPVSPGATWPVRRFLRGFGSHPPNWKKSPT